MRLLALFVALFAATDAAAQQLTEKEFLHLHKTMRPAADEPYLTIPWKTSLLDAQRIAARDGKPIFIWAMDGHPLGCT